MTSATPLSSLQPDHLLATAQPDNNKDYIRPETDSKHAASKHEEKEKEPNANHHRIPKEHMPDNDQLEQQDATKPNDERTRALTALLAAVLARSNNIQTSSPSSHFVLTPALLTHALAAAHPTTCPATSPTTTKINPTDNSPTGTPKLPSPRAHRYAVARLARALASHFDPHATPKNNPPTVDTSTHPPLPPPRVTRETLAFLRESGADAALGKIKLDKQETLVRLGEIVLCAALHSHLRNLYVDAVMSLPDTMQDTLADAVHRAVNGSSYEAASRPRGHPNAPKKSHPSQASNQPRCGSNPDHDEDNEEDEEEEEEDDNDYLDDQYSEETDHDSRHQRSNGSLDGADTTRSLDSDEDNTADRAGKHANFASNENVLTAASQPYPSRPGTVLRETTAENIPHTQPTSFRLPENKPGQLAQAKAIETERLQLHAQSKTETAELRNRVLRLEHELRLKSAELATVSAHAVAVKQSTTRPKPGTSMTAQANRAAAPLVTEMEILRSRAESADVLEANLKRATVRLEKAGEVRRLATELENQNGALRESEQRLQKRVTFLEAQLDSSNARAAMLVKMSESLSKELQAREVELAASRAEVAEATRMHEDAGAQIASLLSSSQSHGSATSDATRPTSTSFNKLTVSAALERELGVNMSWEDIVECVRGVVEAMRELDEDEAAQRQAADAAFSEGQALLNNKRPRDEITQSDGRTSSEQSLSNATTPPNTEAGPHRIPTLRDFIEVDEHMEASGMPGDDDFDFVADHSNVKELMVQFDGCRTHDDRERSQNRREGDGTPSVSSRFANASTFLPRRRSSTPSLPTVPENSEGFVVQDQSPHCYDRSRASTEGNFGGEEASSSTSYPANNSMRDQDVDPKSRYGLEESDESPVGANIAFRPEPQMGRSFNDKCHPSPVDTSPATGGTSQASLTFSDGIVQRIVGVYEDMKESDICAASSDGMEEGQQMERRPSTPTQALDLLAGQLAEQSAISNAKERECAELRHELSLLIKEVDGVIAQRDSDALHETELRAEKERMVSHLQEALASRSEELSSARLDLGHAREEVDKLRVDCHKLRLEKIGMTEEIVASSKQFSEQIREREIQFRSHEHEISQLRAQLEAKDVADRDEVCRELLNAARREMATTEAIREDIREASKLQSEKLSEIHKSALEAAADREYNVDMRLCKSRKSTRFGALLRRLGNRDGVSEYDTMLTLRPVCSTNGDALVGSGRPNVI